MNKFKFIIFIISVFFISTLHAQKPMNEIISNALAATDKQLPALGMYVLSIEDGKKVLLSKTGRYIVKGTVTDMWDGMQENGQQSSAFPKFPTLLDPDEFTLSFGDKNKPEILSYLSFSCGQCQEVLEQLLSPEFLKEHSVRIMLVSNTDEDKVIASNVYCSSDTYKTFQELFVKRNLDSVNPECIHPQIDMNISLANAQRIKALPSTYSKEKNIVYLGANLNQI